MWGAEGKYRVTFGAGGIGVACGREIIPHNAAVGGVHLTVWGRGIGTVEE